MKQSIYKASGLVLYSILGIIPVYILNLIIEGIIIPDPCYYHARDTTKLFDLFYKMESSEGYPRLPHYLIHCSPCRSGLRLVSLFAGRSKTG